MTSRIDYKYFIKEHLLASMFVVSALIQLMILLLFHFPTGIRNFTSAIPMTILPYSELNAQTIKKDIKKEVEITEDLDEAEVEEEKKVETKISPQNFNKTPLFLPFVRVDEIAKSRTSLMPLYPDAARNAGIQGTVVLEVYIDKKGRVRDVNIKKGIGFGCDEAAIEKVKSTIFMPARMGGKAVAVRQIISFDFKLN